MKLLVAVATYPTGKPVHPLTQDCLNKLELPSDAEIMFYGGDDTNLFREDNITLKHQAMRRDVFVHDFDMLMTIEADMVVPANAFEKLLEVEADVAYGLYVARTMPKMWLCFPEIVKGKAASIVAKKGLPQKHWGSILKSEGMGFGCTLIHRHVLKDIEFRRDSKLNMSDDWFFALDVKEAGFKSAHHLGVVCGHINGNQVFYPDPLSSSLYRVEDLVSDSPFYTPVHTVKDGTYIVRKRIAGREKDYVPGEIIELNAESATILLKLKAIIPMEE